MRIYEDRKEDGAAFRLPARFNNCEGYHDEIKAAGFEIEFIESRKSGVVIYARKSEKDFLGMGNWPR
jgi:hypothetical protein